jgi:hypothetical protein
MHYFLSFERHFIFGVLLQFLKCYSLANYLHLFAVIRQKEELEKIQHGAARIVSRCTKLVSISELYHEICWESLAERCRKHKLILFFKMVNGISPEYMCNLVPNILGETSQYNLQYSTTLQIIPSRTSLYANSFVPSTFKEWNELPLNVRHAKSLNNF